MAPDKKYVVFEHSEERLVKFTDISVNTGWFTTVASSDDYYIWKLSPKAIKKLEDEARQKIIRQLGGTC